ncbi:MAG TPA: preprotein translocase subunit SecE [Synechococcales cyanobacterium M55_K2018_004]|nr:preprotein translocase subunit SecE [Synechococcales cyanobacterium M55_K2018_004]
MAKKDEAKAQDSKATESKAAEKKKDESSADTKVSEEQSGFNLTEFLQGTKEELDKVVWPSRQQLVSESVAVILMVILSATTIYLVDNLFSWAARQVF